MKAVKSTKHMQETNVDTLLDNIKEYMMKMKEEDPARYEYWIKVLVEEKVGWIKSNHLNIMWIDPEEYL